jgi:hypothetical protein
VCEFLCVCACVCVCGSKELSSFISECLLVLGLGHIGLKHVLIVVVFPIYSVRQFVVKCIFFLSVLGSALSWKSVEFIDQFNSEELFRMASSPQQVHSIRNIVNLVQTGKLKTQDGNGNNFSNNNVNNDYNQQYPPKSTDSSQQQQQLSPDDTDRRSDTSTSSSKLTSESRWLLIKQLAQRKAAKSNQQFNNTNSSNNGGAPDADYGPDSADQSPESGMGMNNNNNNSDYYSAADTDSHQRYGRPTPMSPKQRQQFEQQQQYNQYDDPKRPQQPQYNPWVGGGAVNDRPRQSSSSPSNRQQQQQRARSADPRNSYDNSFFNNTSNNSFNFNLVASPRNGGTGDPDDMRAFRAAQNVAALHDEHYKECTFQPKFYTSDRSRSKDAETPFYARVQRWQSQREVDLQSKRQSLARMENEHCSFAPRLNRNSLSAAMELRGAVGPDATPETIEDVATRLHRSHEESLLLKGKYIEMEMKRVQEEEMRACTFKPNTSSTASKYAEVKPKYYLEETYKHNKTPVQDPLEKEYTFTPSVKGAAKHMASAKAYLSKNVVDRLSKPLPAVVDDSSDLMNRGPRLSPSSGSTPFDIAYGGNVMDMNSYLSGNNNNNISSGGSVGSHGSGTRRRSGTGSPRAALLQTQQQQQAPPQNPLNSIFRSSFSHSVERPSRASSAPRERTG